MVGNEQFVEVGATGGVKLYTEAFGDRADPAVLLIHGAGHSAVAWDDEFVARLAAGGRYVVRYDSRDAGRSTASPVGQPDYNLRTLVADAAEVIAALGIGPAHIVAMSQGAAVGQLLALDHPGSVATLTLASSTPGGPGHDADDLPPMTEAVQALFAEGSAEDQPGPDRSDRDAVIAYLVEAERPFAAHSRPFDEDGVRAMAERVVDRTADVAAQVTNPFMIDAGEPWRSRLADVAAPTLVLHGTEDPLFPPDHGRALAAEIPGARFKEMPATGHEVFPRPVWDEVVPAILAHTG
ncbi:alpha/beta fold hydrolase [Yinghuangia sp. YIM S09857]|uniref:alpha/beta fold hydrolase n=1 Tax=Yinghuangia sp. YIM S09857 TaxID=3436929 RepID=UPI003F53DE50